MEDTRGAVDDIRVAVEDILKLGAVEDIRVALEDIRGAVEDTRGAAVADNRKEVVHDTSGTPAGVEDIRREAAVHIRKEVESGRTRMGRTLAEVVVAGRKQGGAHALAAGTHGPVPHGMAGACGWAGLNGLADPAGCTSPSWAAQKHPQPEQEQDALGRRELRVLWSYQPERVVVRLADVHVDDADDAE